MCEESRFLFLSRNQRDSREGQADPKGTCVHTCVRPVSRTPSHICDDPSFGNIRENIGRSYTARIPSTLRGQFARCSHSVNLLTVEGRNHVINTGSLRFVKVKLGQTYDMVYGVTNYIYADLDRAIYEGYWKVFQYIYEIHRIKSGEVPPIFYILLSMTHHGRLDWMRRFTATYSIKFPHQDHYNYMTSALLEQHHHIIRYFVQNGVDVTKDDICALGPLLLQDIGIANYKAELDHLHALLLPIIAELRAKYPDKVSGATIKALKRV